MCSFEVPDAATMTVSRRQVNEIKEIGRHDQAVRHAAELIASQISALTESSAKRDVIVLALPVPFIEKLVNTKSE
jgi:prephenate dehydrogenase